MQTIKQQKILVIKLGALGDFFATIDVFARLRDYHAGCHITLATTKPFAAIAAMAPYCNAVWTVEKPKFFELSGWFQIYKQLQLEKFDAVYDLQRNDRTSVMRLLSPALTRNKWLGGVGDVPQGMMDTRIIEGPVTRDLKWLNGRTPSEYGLPEKYVLLVPGSAPQHPVKRWPAQYYADLSALLLKAGYQPVLIGTSSEADVTSAIKKRVPDVIDLTGKTRIEDIASLGMGAAAAIGNDTGPMHILSVSGCPVISLFSCFSNPDQSAPRGKVVKVLRAEKMETITPEAVFQGFDQIKRKLN